MSGFDIRTFLQAASAAATVEGGQARPARPSAAVPTAEGVAGVPIRQSYSPVVLAWSGVVLVALGVVFFAKLGDNYSLSLIHI